MSFGIPVRNGLGLGLLASTSLATGNVGGSAPFTPASLFASGAPGFLLDATLADLSSLFQDSAGTIPAAIEQPVGLVLDTSRGLALGPELVSNPGPFVNTTGYSSHNGAVLSVVSGKLRIAGSGSAFPFGYIAVTTVIGQFYKVVGVCEYVSGSNDVVYIQKSDTATGSTNIVNSVGGAAGTKSLYFVATATTTYLQLVSNSINDVYDWVSLSAKSIAGNHFVQSTSAARPVLSARVNLLTKTEEFNDAAWTKSATTASANTIVAPDGTTTADTIINTTATTNHGVYVNVTGMTASVPNRVVFHIKKSTVRYITIGMWNGGGNCGAGFDLDTNTITGTGATGAGYSASNATVTVLSDGWLRLSVDCTTPDTSNFPAMLQRNTAYTSGSIIENYVGTTSQSTYIWGADLRVANDTASPVYQRVDTATDYDTTGFPIYLRFNETGTDDFLVSAATVNFSTTAQMSVFAGVRKLSDATTGIFLELSATQASNNGAFTAYAPTNNATAGYQFLSKGTIATAAASPTTFVAPISNVFTGLGDISADLATLRLNGIQAAQSTADQGTGNYGNYLTYIGSRGGTTNPLNGRIYFPLVVLGRTATATEIANMESYLSASMGGGYVPTGYDFLVTGDGDQLTDASGNALYTIPLYS